MMVKIAILSHGLIHNTKVILSRCFSTHLCTKYKLPEREYQEVYAFFPLSLVHKVVNQAFGLYSHAEHGAFGVVKE